MQKVYDIIVVGAGAAGMTAALYALRADKTVLIIEQTTHGGQIINTHKVDNYPAAPGISGVEFANRLKSQVDSFGGEFEYASVTHIASEPSEEAPDTPLYRVITDDEDIAPLSRTVILANGSAERKLGLPHEAKFTGRGVSYCATCDGGFFKGKTVAVYGGGNTALYSVLYLANLAQKVYLINRSSHYRADRSLLDKARTLANVTILENTEITELSGDKSLDGITVRDVNTAEVRSVATDGLFVSIGRVPDNAFLDGFVALKDGYIQSDESCETSRGGVFCAGDCRKKFVNQLTTAVGDGAVAATRAIEFLNSSK